VHCSGWQRPALPGSGSGSLQSTSNAFGWIHFAGVNLCHRDDSQIHVHEIKDKHPLTPAGGQEFVAPIEPGEKLVFPDLFLNSSLAES
jgi:hypothetical protein